MSALIEWGTVGQIFAESFAAGVVIVTAFALGARLVGGGSGADPGRPGRGVLGWSLAVLCFLVAAAAVAYGVFFTIDK